MSVILFMLQAPNNQTNNKIGQNLGDMTGYGQKNCVSEATHDCKLMSGGADKFMRAVLLPPAQDTQVGFMNANVPGNRKHLSV